MRIATATALVLCLSSCTFGTESDQNRLVWTPDGWVLDSDYDTIADHEDNCAFVGNTGQADEDADGVGDACDNCPVDANADQANEMERLAGAEVDALGDACDPRPATAGDRLLFFESFEDFEPGRWALAAGSELRAEAGRGYLIGTATPIVEDIEEVRVVTSLEARPAAGQEVAVVTSARGPSGYGCRLRSEAGRDVLELVKRTEDEDVVLSSSFQPSAARADFRLVAHGAPGARECSLGVGGSAFGARAMVDATPGAPGLSVTGHPAGFHYLVAYTGTRSLP